MWVQRSHLAPGVAAAVLAAGLLAVPATQAATTPGCVSAHLRVANAGREGAAGHRFDRFRITNTGAVACRLFGYPTFRFRNRAGRHIGFSSVPAGVPAQVVVLRRGARTRVSVGTVNPDVTLASQCHAETARSVDIRLPNRRHVYRVADTNRVCTTARYRPTSYPVGF